MSSKYRGEEVSGTPLTPSTRRCLVDLKTYSPGGSGCLGYIWWPKDKVDGDRSVWTYIMFLFGKNLISKNMVSYNLINLGNSKHIKYLKIDQRFKTVLVFLSYRDRMEVIQLTVTCQSNFLTENSQAQWGKKAEGCLVTPYSSDFLCLDCLAS